MPASLPFGVSMLAPVLYTFGTDEQKAKFLPGIYNGEVWWCQGYSEPGAGSDLASLKTKAERIKGDDGKEYYLVNGQKTWTTLAQNADWGFFLVRTDPTAKPQAGISFLLIDMKSPGVTVRPIITLEGGHEVNDVFLDNVKVPVENRIFHENQGWTCAKALLAHERSGIAGVARSKRGLEKLRVDRCAPSGADAGGTLLSDAFLRRKVAELEIDLAGAGIHRAAHAGRRVERQGPRPGELDPRRSRCTEIQQRLQELVLEAAGHYGAPAPARPRPQRARSAGLCRRRGRRQCSTAARCLDLSAGSNEIQRNIIAKKDGAGAFGSLEADPRPQRLTREGLARDLTDRWISASPKNSRCCATRSPATWPTTTPSTSARRAILGTRSPAGSPAVWKRLRRGSLGILGAPFSEELGGLGGGPVENMIVMEEFGKALVVEPYLGTVVIGGGFLKHSGHPNAEALIGQIIAGEAIFAFAYAEPQGRYNLADLKTTAKKDGGAYVLNGMKAVVVGAPYATHLIVTARTDGGQRDAQGISVFIVEKGAAGVTTRDYPTVDGFRASEVYLENVKVDADALVGPEGQALPLVETVVDEAIAATCAEACGVLRKLHEGTLEYTKQRKQFGQPISSFQVLQHRMVDMFIQVEQARSPR